jgi:23S rRNA pseudouridine955/2504/2580 synthase
LVHRLDRETSGCILIAKKKSKLKTLHELMRAHSIEKKYIMLVKGEVTWKKKRVDLSLSKNILQSGERMVCVDEGGKEAVTHFGCLATGNGVSLLEATLETGRTHQLRVHCAALGHPILGDTKYGDREANKTCASYGLKRLYLHALSLRWRESNAIPEQVYVAPLPVLLSDLAARIMGHALPHIRIPSHATD